MHTPVEEGKNGSISVPSGWFNYLGQWVDYQNSTHQKEVTKAQIVQALLMILNQQQDVAAKAYQLACQMPVSKRGRKKG